MVQTNIENLVVALQNNVKPATLLDKKVLLQKENLEYLYIEKQLSTVDISKLCTVGRDTVSRYLKKFGIPVRSPKQGGYMKSIKSDSLLNDFFTNIDSDEKAYVFGILLGDGYVTKNKIILTLAKMDEQIIYDIAQILNANDYIHHKKSRSENEQDKISLAFRRTDMVNDLIANGFVISPKSLHEPFVQFDNDMLTWSFIRGVFDADGCIRYYDRIIDNKIYKKYKISFTCGQDFCYGLKNFIETKYNICLPLRCVHRQQQNQGTYVFEVASRDVINLFKNNMYNNSKLFLKRKKNIFDLIM